MARPRRHPRFVTRTQVELRDVDRAELRQLWMQDISKGGLFVATDQPPELRARVEVQLATNDGALGLSAEVVHVLDADTAARMGTEAGVGLQFVDLDDDRRAAIEAYVDGLAERLGTREERPAPTADAGAVLRVVRQVLDGFERDDVYAAIGLEPLASDPELQRRVRNLSSTLESLPAELTAAQVSRAQHVRSLVRRIGGLLSDSARRLDYDLRHGHVYARERLAGASRKEQGHLRAAWHRLHPEAMPEAEKHASLALRYEGVMKYDEAIREAERALELDPFNPDLWKAVDTWRYRLRLAQQSEAPPSAEKG